MKLNQFLKEDQATAIEEYKNGSFALVRMEQALANGNFRETKQEAVKMLESMNKLETMQNRKETLSEVDALVNSLKSKGINVEKVLLKKGEL